MTNTILGFFILAKKTNRDGIVDTITSNLIIDGKVLKEIIQDLYYPNPYEFSLFPADIFRKCIRTIFRESNCTQRK